MLRQAHRSCDVTGDSIPACRLGATAAQLVSRRRTDGHFLVAALAIVQAMDASVRSRQPRHGIQLDSKPQWSIWVEVV